MLLDLNQEHLKQLNRAGASNPPRPNMRFVARAAQFGGARSKLR